ncbi:MAG: phosphatase PAP2 family protein [Elusimicrobia bacterium]|nr:phosphatase PAP2 family protein [Elusimicrobiota bacterium]
MNNFDNLSIIIPVINELANLKKLLPILRQKYPGLTIIVSDDGSTDGTRDYIAEDAKTTTTPLIYLERKGNEFISSKNISDSLSEIFYSDKLKIRDTAGLTASVLDALLICTSENFAVMDADFQHPVELPGNLVEKLDDHTLSVAHRKTLKDFPPHRKLMSLFGNFISNSVLPSYARAKDPLSGAFAGKTEFFANMIETKEDFGLEGFKVLFDFLKLLPKDSKIANVGYDFQMRSMGESKIGFKQIRCFYRSVFDKHTVRFISGVLVLMVCLLIGNYLVFKYGDINLSTRIRALGKDYPSVSSAFRIITNYGHHLYHFIFLYILVIGYIKKRKDMIRLGWTYVMVQLLVSIAICGAMKMIIGRPRPRTGLYDFKHFSGKSRFRSFPSGHTTDAFSSAGVVWGYSRSYILSIIAFIFSGLVGFSRIILSSHFPLDVVTGMVLGFGGGLIITYIRFRKPETRRKSYGQDKNKSS